MHVPRPSVPSRSERPAFLVCGYGVPSRDIILDGNYDRYLRAVFNAVFDRSAAAPVLLFSGGPTDMVEPYGRTEAAEMARAFRILMERPTVAAQARGWKVLLEERALSSLDNLLYARSLFSRRRFDGPVVVCGERTRAARLRTLSCEVFGPRAGVLSVDFDHSESRYLDPGFLRSKERFALAWDRWGLASPGNLKKHRALHAERLSRLRAAGPADHQAAVKAWWEEALRGLVPSFR